MTLLLAPLLIGSSLLFRAQSDASSAPAAPVSYETITVQPGDTLWSIATELAPDADPRSVIYEIRQINGLSSAALEVGQQLALPGR